MVRVQLVLVTLTAALFAVFLGAPRAAARAGELDAEAKALRGEWTTIWVIDDFHRKLEPGDCDSRWIKFFPQKGEVINNSANGTYKGRYTIDASKNPRHLNITWEGKEKPALYIYKIEGDELWMSWGGGGPKRPKSFKKEDYLGGITIYKKKQ
jgi:uncharacterized protein (TIGR03067 family)